jgi:RNA-directed DNA polymerase
MTLLHSVSNKLLMTEDDLLRFSLTMPRRYKTYYIFKRNGIDLRLIAHPSRESKLIQRVVVDELRPILPISKCATAYEKGTSIRLNALRHVNSRYILKMDCKNFFPSITPELLFFVAEKNEISISEIDKIFLENVLFYKSTRRAKLRMSIGAPSSPFISNFIMKNFDDAMEKECFERNITYTRYADDMTFTTNRKDILFDVPKVVTALLNVHCNKKIRINSEKTVFSSKRFNRHVTGIVLTNNDELSIGRARKREIFSLMNSCKYNKLDGGQRQKLKGLINFAQSIEHDFISRLKKKYGDWYVEDAMR